MMLLAEVETALHLSASTENDSEESNAGTELA